MGADVSYKLAGWSILVSVALAAISSLLNPGLGLIDTAGSLDLDSLLTAKMENQGMTHLTTSLAILAAILGSFGVVTLWRNQSGGGLGGGLVSLGLVAVAISLVFWFAARGLDHMAVHLIVHGDTTGFSDAVLNSSAAGIISTQAALFIVSSYASTLGFLSIFLGLYLNLPAGLRKVGSLILALLSVIQLVILLVAGHSHDLVWLYQFSVLFALPTTIAIVYIAIAMVKGSLPPSFQSET